MSPCQAPLALGASVMQRHTSSAVTSGHMTSTRRPSSFSTFRQAASSKTMMVGFPRMLVFQILPYLALLTALAINTSITKKATNQGGTLQEKSKQWLCEAQRCDARTSLDCCNTEIRIMDVT